jgi:uncharacterized membrane protein YcaP (DUF421 family)
VIRDGQVLERELRRLAIRRAQLDHAVRVQNGDDISEVQEGSLSGSGHLVLTLKPEAQNATRGDIEQVLARLAALEARLDQR